MPELRQQQQQQAEASSKLPPSNDDSSNRRKRENDSDDSKAADNNDPLRVQPRRPNPVSAFVSTPPTGFVPTLGSRDLYPGMSGAIGGGIHGGGGMLFGPGQFQNIGGPATPLNPQQYPS